MMQIILIGMPGCGKTTVGRLLANRCGYAFLDLDTEIERDAKRKISEIFAKEGEDTFRAMETAVLKKALLKEKTVISTGGGIIVREENRKLMQEKGTVVFLDRPLEKILSDVDIQERPLLAEGKEKVKLLYNQRYDYYCKTAAIRILNDLDAETAVVQICQALGL